ncbi:histidine kinase [Klebsiella pneumoniae]|uniref:Histidine kinase n=1 Tax=Klebsiella pneumoniae TaxID=573 RepID=A0A378B4P3_KLEPN|nr:histidine kinase [Klebsiella pneumoniae]
MIGIRRMIEAQVLGLTGMALKEIDFERPKGERGCLSPVGHLAGARRFYLDALRRH